MTSSISTPSGIPATHTVSLVTGGLVFDGAGFTHADVLLDGASIARVSPTGDSSATVEPHADVIDAEGCYVIPGLVDIHTHGCLGADFSDGSEEGLHAIAAYEASRGVTSWCPTSMTLPTESLERAFSSAAGFVPGDAESRLVGINMEGPYISPRKVGAQNPAYVRPADVREFTRLQEAARGLVRLVDVAPEEPGNLAFISQVSQASPADAAPVRVSLAHMVADYDCVAEAFRRGARHLTHLFNAMPGLHHREPGPIAAAAERDDVTVEVIADGIHVHPSMVRMAFQLFGPDRVILISDSMRACGLEDGEYDLGGQSVTVHGARATLADGTLAGSVTDLMACLRTAVELMEIPLEHAVRAATINPARALGIADACGSIAPGLPADLVVLDADLSVCHVVLRGRLVR